ncbi:MAG: arginase [Fimbriimonadaceae bacterium]|nr:arginase [Fimbriimonadaceae bacterium]
MIDLIGVPFDLGGPVLGSRLGPAALRIKGLSSTLTSLGVTWCASEDVVAIDYDGDLPLPTRYEKARNYLPELRRRVTESLNEGRLPLVMGGDHSLSIGSVAGALTQGTDDLAVLWIDAHMDLNTPDTTPSGNLHGMSVAGFTRLPTKDRVGRVRSWGQALTEAWPKILDETLCDLSLPKGNVAWIGLRDVDEGEARHLAEMGGSTAWTMQDIDRVGIQGVFSQFEVWLQNTGASRLWISFDVDVLDPLYAPGTGTAVRGGMTYREGHLLAELLSQLLSSEKSAVRLAGLDVVEVNPLNDHQGETARMAIEWVASLFGKTIMGDHLTSQKIRRMGGDA